MTGERHKQQNRNSPGSRRRERLAQELRSNLLKRKALARARRCPNPEASAEVEESTPRQAHHPDEA